MRIFYINIFLVFGIVGCEQTTSILSQGINPTRDKWKLVWQDEFEGTDIDETKWQIEVNAWGGGNNELQFYTARPKNARVENGCLILEAHKENYTAIDPMDGNEKTRQYTSARLRTKNKGDWKYGRFEVRAKLPKGGKGLWPAIWMLPTDEIYGSWAGSGEIDIMEYRGHETDKVHGTLHYGAKWPNNVHTGKSFKLKKGSFFDDFHVFILEWEEGEIRWYIDGHHYQTQRQWHTEGGEYPAPFNKRFHMLVNLAVGGNWPGNPDGSTVFPQSLLVDYVRLYKTTR